MTGEDPVVQVWRRREQWSGGAALVVVLEAAEVGDLNDRTAGWRLCGPRDRRILVQREVSAPFVIIGQEEFERASKRPLIPHDDVIETLAPQGADQALDERILVRPAKAGAFSGKSPARARARSPVAWMAGRREINDLKPIDKAIVRMVSESPGRSASERTGSPESSSPEGRTFQNQVKAAWNGARWPTRRSTSAGSQRQHGDKDAPSNWRSPSRPAAKVAEQASRITGQPGSRWTASGSRRGS